MAMYTEDDVARELRSGALDVAKATKLFQDGQVYVYAAMRLDPDTARWDEVEERGAGSGDLVSALRAAGGSEEDVDAVGREVERARDEGRTIESLWPKT